MTRRTKRDKRQAQRTTDAPAQRISISREPALQGLSPVAKAAYDAAVVLGEPSARTADAFQNVPARLGYNTPNLLNGTEYPLTRLTQNYQLLNSLYRSNWIVKNIVDTIPEDMCRQWLRIDSQLPPEEVQKIEQAMRSARIRQQVIQGMKWGRLYGGAGGLLLIDGQETVLDQPLDLNTVMPGTFRGIHIIDRWSGIFPDGTLVADCSDPDYGLPESYQIRDGSGHVITRVHHSRIVRFTGANLPYLETIAEQYWGASELEAVYDDIVRRDNVAANIASLTFQANVGVMEIEGLTQLFALGNAQAQQRFWTMMQQQAILRNSLGLQLIEKGTKYETHSYTFAGIANVYSAIQMDLAGATGIPVTKLFGRSPAGLNATGDGDAENYYDRIEQQQESDLRPVMERLLPILAMSTWGEIPDDLDFAFNPVRTPGTKEQSEIVKAKAGAIIQTFKEGIIDQGTAQKELRELAEDTGMFSNVTDAMIQAGLDKWTWELGASANPLAAMLPPPRPNPEDGDADGIDLDE